MGISVFIRFLVYLKQEIESISEALKDKSIAVFASTRRLLYRKNISKKIRHQEGHQNVDFRSDKIRSQQEGVLYISLSITSHQRVRLISGFLH